MDDDQARAIIRSFWLEEVKALRDRHDRERLERNLPPIQNREIAKATGIPASTLSDLMTCKRDVVPDWDRVGLIIDCLGGRTQEWVPKWRKAKAAYDRLGKPAPQAVPERATKRKRIWIIAGSAAIVVAVGVGIAVYFGTRPSGGSSSGVQPATGIANARCIRVKDETHTVSVFKDPVSYDTWAEWPGKTRFWADGGTDHPSRYRVPLSNGQHGWVNKDSRYVVPATDCP